MALRWLAAGLCFAGTLISAPAARAQAPAGAASAQFPSSPAAEAPPIPEPAPPTAEPALAAAQPAPPAAEPPMSARPHPLAGPAADAPPPAADRPAKLFVSLALGTGYFHASSGSSPDGRTFAGGTVAGQLVLAGRIGKSRMQAIGGAYLRDQVFALSSKDELVDGDEPRLDDVDFGLWLLGFFSDFSLQQAPGLHIQTILGFSGLSVDAPGRDLDSPFGLALNVGVGYDFRLGRHLAVGALLRATYASLSSDENAGTTVSNFVPALLLTATTR